MDPIEIMANQDGSIDLPGFHIVPYVAPVTVDPVPVSDPVPTDPVVDPTPVEAAPTATAPTLVGMTLTADKDVTALQVGDVFNVSGVLNYSDGSTKPVPSNAFGGFDKAIVTNPNSWTGTFTAKAPGTTTITDSNSGVAGKLKVTVLADGSTSTSDPSSTDTPTPVLPPAPMGADKVTFRNTLATVGRRAIFSAWPIPDGSPIQSATIDWGDGTSQTINVIYQALRHDYPADGDYTITLNAVATNGDYGSKTIAVSVAQLAEPPEPTATAADVAHLTATLKDGSA